MPKSAEHYSSVSGPADGAGAPSSAAAAGPTVIDLDGIPLSSGNMSQALRPWHYGFFTLCGDCDSCLEALCCPYCQLSRQYNMLYNLDPTVHWPLCLGAFTCSVLVGTWVSSILLWSLRKELRQRYAIDGSGCTDCLASCCCSLCTLQQQHLEMNSLGCGPGAFFGPSQGPVEPVML